MSLLFRKILLVIPLNSVTLWSEPLLNFSFLHKAHCILCNRLEHKAVEHESLPVSTWKWCTTLAYNAYIIILVCRLEFVHSTIKKKVNFVPHCLVSSSDGGKKPYELLGPSFHLCRKKVLKLRGCKYSDIWWLAKRTAALQDCSLSATPFWIFLSEHSQE